MILKLYATPEEVMRAVEVVQEIGRQKGLSERETFGLALALEECGSNIVNYALRKDPAQSFQVTIEDSEASVTIELRDRGPEFDPTQVRVRVPTAHEDDRPPGGWGIQLVRRYMDEITYRREGGENVLRLTKSISREEDRQK
jgi:serine/threonine-protein kinase RsbW